MDALRVPDPDASVEHLSVKARRALPPAEQARPLAPRRAHQPPRRGDRRLARATPREPRPRHRRHSRPLLPRQRRRVDPRAGPRLRHPAPGHQFGWPSRRLSLRKEEKAESKRQRTLARASSGFALTQGAPGQAEGSITGYEELVAQAKDARRATGAKIRIPMTKRPGDVVVAAEGLTKGFEKLLIDDFEFNFPRWHRRHHRSERRRQDHAQDDHRLSLDLELRVGETVDLAYGTSHATPSTPPSRSGKRSRGHDIVNIDGHEMNSRAYVSAFNFTERTSSRRSAPSPAGERNCVHFAKLLKSGGNLMLSTSPPTTWTWSIRNLEEALLTFPGCAVVISHDRYF